MESKNPSFNIVYLDSKTLVTRDIETWYFDIEKANKEDRPSWTKYINYRDTYEIDSLSPSNLMSLSTNILQSEKEAVKFTKNMYVGGKEVTSCDEKCRATLYCKTSSSDYNSLKACFEANGGYHSFDDYSIITDFEDWITHHWYKRRA